MAEIASLLLAPAAVERYRGGCRMNLEPGEAQEELLARAGKGLVVAKAPEWIKLPPAGAIAFVVLDAFICLPLTRHSDGNVIAKTCLFRPWDDTSSDQLDDRRRIPA